MDDKKANDLYHYWMSWIKRSRKLQPIKAWQKAENMLLVDKESEKTKPPYLSGFRLLYESLKSYLDQQAPTFDIVPTKAYFGDETALKNAECDNKYLSYIWEEQELQKVQSQKLDSTLIRNVGYSGLGFDTRKWMPTLKYLKPEKVYPDPDCDGIKENAKAIAYEEDISAEEFVSKYKTVDINRIFKRAGSILTKEQQDELPDGVDKKMFQTIKIYHIFARGDAALRKGEDPAEVPKEKDVISLIDTVPKRYLQFAEGYNRPLSDENKWPYDLDNNEFPITDMMFNTVSGNYYSYTDNSHQERTDELCDNLLKDAEENAYFAGKKKFAGSPLANDLTRENVEKFLNDPERYYLPDMLNANGEPKIKQIDVGKYESGIMEAYKTFDEIRTKASALGELLSATAEEYKDVTAIAVRVQDANAHQRINRRLGGPMGYEESIREDAIKILEIAHQYVPTYSVIEMPKMEVNELNEAVNTTEMVSLPWPQVKEAIKEGGRLIQLGVDAIVGQELALYWREGQPQLEFKLSTTVRVKKGSTRDITQENKAALMKQYYVEVLQPLYVATNRLDLATEYVKRMGQMAAIEHIDELVPSQEDAQNVMMKNAQMEQLQAQQTMEQGAGMQGGQVATV